MKNAKEFWLESKPICLPFKSEASDYTIQEMDLWCPDCHKKAEHLRGTLEEKFGCIEMRISGICEPCKIVVDNRMRIYPAQHRFLTLKNGEWMEGEMKANIFYRGLDFVKSLWDNLWK